MIGLVVPYIPRLAGRVASSYPVDLDDLISVGHFALVWSADRFRPERGAAFKTFALRNVHGAMLDHVRSEYRLDRANRRHAILTDDIVVPLDAAGIVDDVFQEAARLKVTNLLRRAVAQLSPRDQFILERHYRSDYTMNHIGRLLGFGESWVSYRHKAILAQLRTALT